MPGVEALPKPRHPLPRTCWELPVADRPTNAKITVAVGKIERTEVQVKTMFAMPRTRNPFPVAVWLKRRANPSLIRSDSE